MRIAFVGKGGSGKTTLSSLFIRHLAAASAPVLAIDADINQHLGTALGLDERTAAGVPPLSRFTDEIKDYLRGDNPRIPSAAEMVKTTTPGSGSRLLRFGSASPLDDWCTYDFSRTIDEHSIADLAGVRLMVTGVFDESDLGVACYHSKVGAAELYLNHLIDGPGEYVVMDMTAGADAFASGLFTRFDATFLVVEPTRKSVSVYRQYREYADEYGIVVHAVGNKITEPGDLAFLRGEIGDALIGGLTFSRAVRAQERGERISLEQLEPENRTLLADLQRRVDEVPKDWARYTELAHHFHVKNAHRWANSAVGKDVTTQIDPDFSLVGHVAVVSGA
ncbi:MAG TPA: ATP-binding protein [Actinocrinis sp.]|uniref:ATP-binding protein n=1 Tax=Actinocrinis sp. TaxID=1920516 RepID=UPI002D670098|nr:ATP-binding protein [Actinocrinis sp.]HZU57169.1 ATP-binding protein [Actinocrinis sp.]